MGKPLRVLIVEDSEDDAHLLRLELRRSGYEPDFKRVETSASMRKELEQQEWDVVISDYVMPTFSGLEALSVLKESGLDVPFIIVSGNIGEDIAVKAMKAGAHDYILKGHLARLVPAIERELREAETRRARKRSEKERIRLSAAVESAGDAVVISDPRGIIQYVNPAFAKITGYARDEVVGRDLHFLDIDQSDDLLSRGMREAMKGREGAWTGRITSRKKDGTLYEEECTFSPINDSSGEIINFVFLKRDITEKLRLESIAQAMDTMNNIGYIFTGVRHEIGNPLNAVMLTLGLIKDKIDTYDKATIKQYIDRALINCDKVAFLLQSLRSFNMYEEPELQVVAIADLLMQFVALVKEDFEKKGITIETFVEAERVYADPRALQQVLLNVFTNAADALAGRDNPKITVSVTKAGRMVRIQVHDNGCGIPEGQLKDLFKPFHTSKIHGNGLGLVIVKKMLTTMNGTISVKSRKDEGTSVEILIPEKRN